MLNLPNVTLVLIDTQCPELARLALQDSLRGIQFGRVLVASPESLDVAGVTDEIRIDRWDNAQHAYEFAYFELPHLMQTPYVLHIEWDAWIVDPDYWHAEFLDYDFVGAPWWYADGMNVGNGCGLRSRAFKHFLAASRDRFPPRHPEDETLCRVYRPKLERYGFRFAPENIAAKFAFECTRPSETSRHFMFHGLQNFHMVLDDHRFNERAVLVEHNAYVRRSGKLKMLRKGTRPRIIPRLGR